MADKCMRPGCGNVCNDAGYGRDLDFRLCESCAREYRAAAGNNFQVFGDDWARANPVPEARASGARLASDTLRPPETFVGFYEDAIYAVNCMRDAFAGMENFKQLYVKERAAHEATKRELGNLVEADRATVVENQELRAEVGRLRGELEDEREAIRELRAALSLAKAVAAQPAPPVPKDVEGLTWKACGNGLQWGHGAHEYGWMQHHLAEGWSEKHNDAIRAAVAITRAEGDDGKRYQVFYVKRETNERPILCGDAYTKRTAEEICAVRNAQPGEDQLEAVPVEPPRAKRWRTVHNVSGNQMVTSHETWETREEAMERIGKGCSELCRVEEVSE